MITSDNGHVVIKGRNIVVLAELSSIIDALEYDSAKGNRDFNLDEFVAMHRIIEEKGITGAKKIKDIK